jgi:deoxyribodipyrimidine photo-lyase
MSTAIVLFCDDFRVVDNPALYYACEKYDNIIPLYIYKKDYLGRDLGSAASVFLHHVILSFDDLLKKEYNINLVIKSGELIDIIDEIIADNKIDAIYFNESYSKHQIEMESSIKKKYKDIDVKSFIAKILFHPDSIKNKSRNNFQVFTPFSKECILNEDKIGNILEKPLKIKSVHNLRSLNFNDLNLLPQMEGNWHEKIISHWSFNYDDIEKKYLDFVDNKIQNYASDRNIPSINGTSKISPYLRFGILSPKWCYKIASFRHKINGYELPHNTYIKDGEKVSIKNNQFILELLWREFAYHSAFYFDDIHLMEIKSQYSAFSWKNDLVLFEKWKNSSTGFDIVDAGMGEIWNTGYMHNRVRMIVASFLIKDLLVDWRIGEQYFWDTLVDADYAINPFSWQWVFGSGLDAAPYFRIFNPDLQAEKFDPNLEYRKKWLDKKGVMLRCIDHNVQKDVAMKLYKMCF